MLAKNITEMKLFMVEFKAGSVPIEIHILGIVGHALCFVMFV